MCQGQSKSQSLLGREEVLREEVTWPLWPWPSPLSSRSLRQVLRLVELGSCSWLCIPSTCSELGIEQHGGARRRVAIGQSRPLFC